MIGRERGQQQQPLGCSTSPGSAANPQRLLIAVVGAATQVWPCELTLQLHSTQHQLWSTAERWAGGERGGRSRVRGVGQVLITLQAPHAVLLQPGLRYQLPTDRCHQRRLPMLAERQQAGTGQPLDKHARAPSSSVPRAPAQQCAPGASWCRH